MAKILGGIQRYRAKDQPGMADQLRRLRENPADKPSAVFFSCVDSRVVTSRITQTQVGDMFVVRNAGNLVPHSSLVSPTSVATEPGVLELACSINSVENVVVCGHSDCKAMNLLHSLHTSDTGGDLAESPLRSWMARHGAGALRQFAALEKDQFQAPLMLEDSRDPAVRFQAFVDPEARYGVADRLSMVSTLVQMNNVTSYPFMRKARARVHGLWLDMATGEVHCFSRRHKTFVVVNDDTIHGLMEEVDEDGGNVVVEENLLRTARDKMTHSEKCSHGD